jgi:hypothetical protein
MGADIYCAGRWTGTQTNFFVYGFSVLAIDQSCERFSISADAAAQQTGNHCPEGQA